MMSTTYTLHTRRQRYIFTQNPSVFLKTLTGSRGTCFTHTLFRSHFYSSARHGTISSAVSLSLLIFFITSILISGPSSIFSCLTMLLFGSCLGSRVCHTADGPFSTTGWCSRRRPSNSGWGSMLTMTAPLPSFDFLVLALFLRLTWLASAHHTGGSRK